MYTVQLVQLPFEPVLQLGKHTQTQNQDYLAICVICTSSICKLNIFLIATVILKTTCPYSKEYDQHLQTK